MDKLGRIARMLQPTLLGLALLLAGMGFYHYRYVPTREAEQTDRLFRHLTEISEQIAQKFANLTTCLQNAAAAALSGTPPSPDSVPLVRWPEFRSGVESFVPPLTISPDFRVDNSRTAEAQRAVTAEITRSGSKTPLRCHLSWGTNQVLLTANVSADFGELVSAITSRHEFQDLLLVSADGRVLSQPGGGLPPLEHLPELNLLTGTGLSASQSNLVRLGEVIAPTRATAEISGRRFILFLVPLALPVTEAASGMDSGHWLLAGVTEERELVARARPLPYGVVFGFVAVVMLLGILLPFLNILTESGRSPIHSQHVVFLVSATLTGACGLVVILNHVAQHRHQEAQLDRELAGFAEAIEDGLHTEIRQTVAWLNAFQPAVLQGTELEQLPGIARFDRHPFWSTPAGRRFPAATPAGLKLVQWVQTNGDQGVKWSTSANITPRVSVRDRDYFRELLSGRSFPEHLSEADYGVARRFYVQPIYSRLRAEYVLTCSIPAPTNRLGGFNNLAVVCAEFQPASLMKAVLPAGFHFAVVDATGRVLFHSDPRRNQQEDILVECNADPRLVTAIAGRGRDSFEADYYQRRHQFSVGPIEGLPWMLVVMREHRLLDSIRASQATATITVLTACGLGVLLVLWSATALRRIVTRRAPGLPRWLWPNVACLPAYKATSWLHGGIVAIAVLLDLTQFRMIQHPGIVAGMILVGPVSVAASCLWNYFRTRRDPLGRQSLSKRGDQHRFVAWLALSLAVLVLPAALSMHRVIGEIEAERFVRWTQSVLADSAWARLKRDPDPGRTLAGSPFGDYPSVFLGTKVSWLTPEELKKDPPADPPTVFGQLLHVFRRDFKDDDDVGTRMHGWGQHHAADGSWWTVRSGEQTSLVERKWHPQAHLGALKITSQALTFPGVGAWDGWFLVSLGGIGLGLLAVWLSALFIAHRVLLLGKSPPDSAPLPSLLVAVAVPRGDSTPQEPLTPSHPLRSFITSFRNRTVWSSTASPEASTPQPGSILIWDRRGMTAPPERSLGDLWIQAASELDCQVVLLVSTERDAALLAREGTLAVPPKLATQPWPLSPGPTPTEDVLRALGMEYRERWDGCSPAEQKVLAEVARSGFEDAANTALTGLLHSGLLRIDPKLRVPGAGWRRFVRSMPQPDPSPEDAAEGGWPVLRTLLVVAAVAIMAFLMLTQPDTWQRTTGVVAGLLAGFKLMGDFLGAVRKEAAGAESGK